MLLKIRGLASCILFIVCLSTNTALASSQPTPQDKTAILFAGFGSSPPSAVKIITNINEQVKKAYPKTELKIAFASSMVRSIWKKQIDRRRVRRHSLLILG